MCAYVLNFGIIILSLTSTDSEWSYRYTCKLKQSYTQHIHVSPPTTHVPVTDTDVHIAPIDRH